MKKNLILSLRKLLDKNNLDGYLIPKNDAYFSEFATPNRLKIISNFTGSAGYAILLKKKNFLFVDGRYTIQAEIESGKIFKILEIPKYSPKNIVTKNKEKLIIGFDPQLHTKLYIKKNFNKKFILKPINKNLIDEIVSPQKRKSVKPFYNLSQKIAGESVNSKIRRLIKKLRLKKIDNIFISAPENVAWLLNLRGSDNPHSPIPNSKLILTKSKKIYFFSCPKKIFKMKNILEYKNLKFSKYQNFEKIIKNLKGKKFCIDKLTCSISNQNIIESFFKIVSETDPCYLMKSIKNKLEIQSMKNAHIKDGVALTKFIYWIKNSNKKKITETKAQNKLERFRKLDRNYLFPSFNTIAGAGSNGAIVHYRATSETDKTIKKNQIFLCDSGGQYRYGTTDVTRTICFSKQKQNLKDKYTKVLKGHIAVFKTDLKKK